ncbi:MAG TPA: hypothetical protein VNC50_06775 [Planctomycetia bacterium]|nr:hypothetical protein [Planctomycetia bacterium]
MRILISMLAGLAAMVAAVAFFLVHRDEAEAISIWNNYVARTRAVAPQPLPRLAPALQSAPAEKLCESPVRLRMAEASLFLIAAESEDAVCPEILCWPEEHDSVRAFSVR